MERISDAYKNHIDRMVYYNNPIHDETPDDKTIFQQTFNEAFIPPNVDEEREVTVKNSERIIKYSLISLTIVIIISIIIYYVVMN
jgi:hypothetical protein